MVASPINQPEDLHLLKEKCRNLESQCAAYIRSLEAANHNLASEITRRKKAEEAIQNAHDELEKLVAERTKEIRLLKDRLQAENVFLKQELAASHAYGTIIGDSHPIKTVISQIELVAPTDANVLIHGESGTGKELVAREIHKHSSRKEKPLIKVNCATIPKELYESEFFGHVKGSFTGAVKDRIGRFEAADGGTIFLDEVGEIPFDLQSKLLRILQEGEYERLGEDKTRKVDVRIIAATNKDLQMEVAAKRFRDDLFYRLNVFPIQIAPLKDRKTDIQPLATHFAKKLSRELNVPCPRLTKANLIDLQSYHWRTVQLSFLFANQPHETAKRCDMKFNNLEINILYFMCNPLNGQLQDGTIRQDGIFEEFSDIPTRSITSAIDSMETDGLITIDRSRLSITESGIKRLQSSIVCHIYKSELTVFSGRRVSPGR